MIHELFDFLQKRLNTYLKAASGEEDSGIEMVGFPNLEHDPPQFDNGLVHMLLVNLEEENAVRPAEPYLRLTTDQRKASVHPPLQLNLSILFASKFQDYKEALKQLSLVIQFFQTHTVFPGNAVGNGATIDEDFPPQVSRLIMKFLTLSQTAKNEIWSSLKTAYLPSVIYQAQMIVFMTPEATEISRIEEDQIISTLTHK